MRGKRTFRKLIVRMASGNWRWSILCQQDYSVASGFAHRVMDAKREAMRVERTLIKTFEGHASGPAVNPSYRWDRFKRRLFPENRDAA